MRLDPPRHRLRVVQQRHRVQRRAEHEHLPIGLHEPRERAARPVAVVDRVLVAEPGGTWADRDDAGLRMHGPPRARPGAHPLRDPPVVAGRLAGRRVEDRRGREVRLAVLGRPVRRVVDVLLPGRVRRERPIRAEHVEQRTHDRLAAADHPSQRAHPRVDHRDGAGLQAEPAHVLRQPLAGERGHGRQPRPRLVHSCSSGPNSRIRCDDAAFMPEPGTTALQAMRETLIHAVSADPALHDADLRVLVQALLLMGDDLRATIEWSAWDIGQADLREAMLRLRDRGLIRVHEEVDADQVRGWTVWVAPEFLGLDDEPDAL